MEVLLRTLCGCERRTNMDHPVAIVEVALPYTQEQIEAALYQPAPEFTPRYFDFKRVENGMRVYEERRTRKVYVIDTFNYDNPMVHGVFSTERAAEEAGKRVQSPSIHEFVLDAKCE